jgi:glutathione synthase/RimK-type ligase-like ATP-grasp enzyme
MNLKSPRMLIVTTQSWPATDHLTHALHEVGFDVAAVYPRSHPPKCLDVCSVSIPSGALRFDKAIERAILEFVPDMVIPTDDPSMRHLHEIHLEHSRSPEPRSQKIARAIEMSLGKASYFDLIAKKSNLLRFGRRHGLPVPKTIELEDARTLRAILSSLAMPVVLKIDGSWGGLGVQLVQDVESGMNAYRRMTSPVNLALKWLVSGEFNRLRQMMDRRQRRVSVQEYIEGIPANRAVVCQNGRVLAGISVEAIQIAHESGPATVVKFIDNPIMESVAAFIVGKFKMSGFVGFDFMLEHGTRRTLLIEMNARATPICHLVPDGRFDLPGALYGALAGPTGRRRETVKDNVVALFPQEWTRDPQSQYIAKSYHDVPWQYPDLVRAYIVEATDAAAKGKKGKRGKKGRGTFGGRVGRVAEIVRSL